MDERITLDDDHWLRVRETPWDTRAFGFSTAEILDVRYRDPQILDALVGAYLKAAREACVRFSYCRIDASDFPLRRALQAHGFYYAETAMLIANANVRAEAFGRAFRNDMSLSTPETDADFDEIRGLARDAFRYSRFHEDPNIPRQSAERRYFNWIDDLRLQEKEFLVYKAGGAIHAFVVFLVEGATATVILAGSQADKGFLSPFFWSSFLTGFQRRGIRRVEGIVSAANLGVLNLAVKLGFHVEWVRLGFHRCE